MERRRFLQVAGLLGLAVAAPVGVKKLRAEGAKYGGPYWIMLNAGGGWDPTYLCDPKGGTKEDKKSVNQLFSPDQIGQANGISYAPVSYVEGDANVEVYSNKRFFEAHGGRLVVLNGIDTTTNNHDTGSRAVWSGQLAEGYPAFSALVASVAAANQPLPMAFLSNGGYDATAGVVALTRAGNVDALHRVAYPDRIEPEKADSARYHSVDTTSRIAQAQAARLAAMRDKQKLPTLQRSMNTLYLSRQGDDGLAQLAAALDQQKILDLADVPDLAPVAGDLNDLEDLMRQAQLALVAFQAGVAASANLDIGGFDTHNDHDNRQIPQLMKVLRAVDYILTTADAMGIGDRTYVVVGSDFGRTPYYNQQNGKDHWNVTSMMVAFPNGVTPQRRVVGSSTGDFKPLKFDPASLEPAENGIRIEPKHVHRALRKLALLDETPQAKQFQLAGDDLPLFG
jgi:hypothetical protein